MTKNSKEPQDMSRHPVVECAAAMLNRVEKQRNELLTALEANTAWMSDHGCVPPCHSEALRLIAKTKGSP